MKLFEFFSKTYGEVIIPSCEDVVFSHLINLIRFEED